ncbi:DUF421 domain-containing protein [Peribacillus sp. SCS-155]|uniref:DUF421 domain-containing protein n=1 Tax=Peribacillus sedimenti TaxID=3115297 RepID=UPI003905CB15
MRELLNQLPSLPFEIKAFMILVVAVILFRMAGKRNLAEMTVAEAVVRIAVGTVLISPLAMKKEWEAIYGGALLIIGLILLTKIMQWSRTVRTFVLGPPSILIKDGKMMMQEIKKAKLTADEVEIALRRQKVGSVEDVELCTFESSGKFSVTLKPNKSAATKEDIQKLVDLLSQNGLISPANILSGAKTSPQFKEAYDEAEYTHYRDEKK